MRLFVTGGTGVLGRALRPLAAGAGHELRAPSHRELDLFDPRAVAKAVQGSGAILHLATRIPKLDDMEKPGAWDENDRLRTEAARILVDAALAANVHAYVQPTVTFVYPTDGPADEETPIRGVAPFLRSALEAEHQTMRFAETGHQGLVLRFGLLDGPGTGHDRPDPRFGATLHVDDAARALLAALEIRSGVFNVCRDRERVSNLKFKEATGWRPWH